jgi:hypothetical protein
MLLSYQCSATIYVGKVVPPYMLSPICVRMVLNSGQIFRFLQRFERAQAQFSHFPQQFRDRSRLNKCLEQQLSRHALNTGLVLPSEVQVQAMLQQAG